MADKEYRKVWKDGDAVLLTVELHWPQVEARCPGGRRVNRYYDALADRWRQRWEGPLLARAREAAGPETPPWEAKLDFHVTREDDAFLSLYLDAYEYTGGAHGNTVRTGDTWHMPAGTPCTLRELLPQARWWRRTALDEIRRQIGARVAAGESLFFEDWVKLASVHFCPDRFYLEGENAVVFYPLYTIAPYVEGIPTFPLKI